MRVGVPKEIKSDEYWRAGGRQHDIGWVDLAVPEPQPVQRSQRTGQRPSQVDNAFLGP